MRERAAIDYKIDKSEVRAKEREEITLALSDLEKIAIEVKTTVVEDNISVKIIYDQPVEGAQEVYHPKNLYETITGNDSSAVHNYEMEVNSDSSNFEAKIVQEEREIDDRARKDASEAKLMHKLGLNPELLQKKCMSVVDQVREKLYRIFNFNKLATDYDWAVV